MRATPKKHHELYETKRQNLKKRNEDKDDTTILQRLRNERLVKKKTT